jgi:alpha-beta hydrolase superfamily lysophospholipase
MLARQKGFCVETRQPFKITSEVEDHQMAHEEYSWNTREHRKLFAQAWTPEGEIKAVLALVHGLGDRSGRYQDVAGVLNREGYALLGFDLPGHGRSEGPRGYFTYADALDDIDRLLSETARLFPGKPVYLYGHSMGGNLVLYYAIKRQPAGLQGIISTSPLLGTPKPVPGWKISLAWIMKGINPTLGMDNGVDATAISHNPTVVAAYKNDPLVHRMISTRLGWDYLQSIPWLTSHAAEFPAVPLLIMQGNADRIVDPAATKKFARSIKGDITFQIWEGGYHEMHNEPNRDEVFNFLLHWLDRYTFPKGLSDK